MKEGFVKMASPMNKKFSADIAGVLTVEDSVLLIEIEDVAEPVILANFLEDFNGKEVKISCGYKEELG